MGFGWARATLWVASRRARSIHDSSASRLGSVEERVDIGLRVERNEVVNLFAGANETNRQVQFARDGDDDAALRGAIEFRQHDSSHAGVAPEFARLVEAVLAGGRVENQKNIMGRAGND